MSTSTFPAHAPLAVQTRGELVESVHYGSLVALDADGRTVLTRGEPMAAMYPRSALKPLMAVAMVRAGLQLSAEQLALASASHSGSILVIAANGRLKKPSVRSASNCAVPAVMRSASSRWDSMWRDSSVRASSRSWTSTA